MLCSDTWKRHIPDEKLQIYKQLITEGQITKPHVIYNRRTGSTTVEYDAKATHEWILDEMRRLANGV